MPKTSANTPREGELYEMRLPPIKKVNNYFSNLRSLLRDRTRLSKFLLHKKPFIAVAGVSKTPSFSLNKCKADGKLKGLELLGTGLKSTHSTGINNGKVFVFKDIKEKTINHCKPKLSKHRFQNMQGENEFSTSIGIFNHNKKRDVNNNKCFRNIPKKPLCKLPYKKQTIKYGLYPNIRGLARNNSKHLKLDTDPSYTLT